METYRSSHGSRPVITQVQNNTTLWIGHLQTDPTDHFAGQTFICPANGELDNIQVYSAAVQNPGEMVLTLHVFDAENKTWGPILASAIKEIGKSDEEKWIRFGLPPMPVHRYETYGFRLHANDALIAIGEAAAGRLNPFTGQEWHADSGDQNGHYYNYFSLAFKVELCA
ncbi:MAG TPA: hypothetical protein VGQ09_18555 [Chitinophagaceae bacterium]|jgi:hypothetical protein|nr:hypothetical protein [Chitinophagaceae bacterium]